MPGCNNDAQKRLRLENGFEFFEISNGDLKFESLIKIRNSFIESESSFQTWPHSIVSTMCTYST